MAWKLLYASLDDSWTYKFLEALIVTGEAKLVLHTLMILKQCERYKQLVR